MSQQNKVSEEIKHLQSTTLKQNAILGGMRLRVTWHPWVEILNRKWTLENHPSVDKAEMLIHLCYRVCSLWLMQILCIAFAEVTYNERNTEPTVPTLSTQVTTVTLPDKQGQA